VFACCKKASTMVIAIILQVFGGVFVELWGLNACEDT
jgi:hypothetical protein